MHTWGAWHPCRVCPCKAEACTAKHTESPPPPHAHADVRGALLRLTTCCVMAWTLSTYPTSACMPTRHAAAIPPYAWPPHRRILESVTAGLDAHHLPHACACRPAMQHLPPCMALSLTHHGQRDGLDLGGALELHLNAQPLQDLRRERQLFESVRGGVDGLAARRRDLRLLDAFPQALR